MDSPAGLKAQLAPLEARLLSSAREGAEQRLQEARDRAESVLEEAETRARDLLAKARAEGERAAQREAARRLVHAKREARQMVLAAQREAYERLLAAAVGATKQLLQHPAYRELEKRLAATAVELLGADAEILRNPGGVGGVEARKGRRSVDLSLPALARRSIVDWEESVSRLWR